MSHCSVHWHRGGLHQLQGRYYRENESRVYCQNPGPYVNGLCSFHREFQHDGCGCQLAVDEAKDRELGPGPPPDIDPDYEAARDAWVSERRAQ